MFIVNMFRRITPGDIEICDILGRLIEKAIENDGKYQMQRGRLYEYFLTDILSGKMSDKREIQKQMHSLTYSEKSFYMTAVLQYGKEPEKDIVGERLFQLLEQLRGCKPIHYEGNVAAVFPLQKISDKEKLNQQIEQIAENFQMKVGISEAFYGYTQLHAACLQAQALFVHRNTMAYRINKIEEISELDLDDPNIRLRIQIFDADD